MSKIKLTSNTNNLVVNNSVICKDINAHNLHANNIAVNNLVTNDLSSNTINVNQLNSNQLNVTDDVYINNNIYTPVGSILTYSGVSAPGGWLLCNGNEVSKAQYPRLFAVIGNLYGSPVNSNNFVLPNLADRIPVGKSGSNNVADVGGASNVTLSVANLPSHTHTGTVDSAGSHTHEITDDGHTHINYDAYFTENYSGGVNNLFGTSAGTDNDNSYYTRTVTSGSSTTGITVKSGGAHTHTFTTDSTGSGNSIDIRNKYIVLNYIIRY